MLNLNPENYNPIYILHILLSVTCYKYHLSVHGLHLHFLSGVF